MMTSKTFAWVISDGVAVKLPLSYIAKAHKVSASTIHSAYNRSKNKGEFFHGGEWVYHNKPTDLSPREPEKRSDKIYVYSEFGDKMTSGGAAEAAECEVSHFRKRRLQAKKHGKESFTVNGWRFFFDPQPVEPVEEEKEPVKQISLSSSGKPLLLGAGYCKQRFG